MYSMALVKIPVEAVGNGKFSLLPLVVKNDVVSLFVGEAYGGLSDPPSTGDVSWDDPAKGLIVRGLVTWIDFASLFLSCSGLLDDGWFWPGDDVETLVLLKSRNGFSYVSMTSFGLVITPTIIEPPRTFPLHAKARRASILDAYFMCSQFPPGLLLLSRIDP